MSPFQAIAAEALWKKLGHQAQPVAVYTPEKGKPYLAVGASALALEHLAACRALFTVESDTSEVFRKSHEGFTSLF